MDNGIKLAPKAMYNYANGLAGLGLTFSHLHRFDFLPFDHQDAFRELDPFLIKAAMNDYEKNISDFLHGPMGLLYYFINEPYSQRTVNLTDQLYGMYLNAALVDEKGLRIRNTVVEQSFNEFDLCMAHGLAGHLVILSMLTRHSNQSEKIKATIRLILIYFDHAYENDFSVHGGNSCFPTSIDENYPLAHEINRLNYKSRLAWCYGDLGIAYALICAGECLHDNTIIERGLQTALRTTEMNRPKSADVRDIFFCHGAAGVSYLYRKLYKKTGEKLFLEASLNWRRLTVVIYQTMRVGLLDKNFSLNLLDGMPGAVIAMIDSDNDALFNWDQFFLLQ